MKEDKRYLEGDCIRCTKCKINKVIVKRNSQGQLVVRCNKCRLGISPTT